MLNDIKTGTKLLFGFGLAIAVTLIMGIVGRQALVTAGEHMDDVGKNRMPSLYGVQEIMAGQLHVAAGQRGLIHKRMMEPAVRQANYEEVADGFRQAAEGRKIYELLPMTQEEQRIWSSFVPRWEEWQRSVQGVVDLEREKDTLISSGAKLDDPRVVQIDDRTMEATRRTHDARVETGRLLGNLARLNSDYGKTAVEQSEASASKNIAVMLAAMLLGAILAAAVGFAIARSIKNALDALRREAARLAEAAVSGQLATRANVMAVPAEFRGIVQGVNDTLDAVINPLNVAADYVDKIARGNIPPKITDNYNGDFNVIKSNLNQLITNLNQLSDDMAVMSKQHDAGDIDIKMPEDKFEGAYRVMAKGVNDMVFGHIAVKKKAMACIAEFGRGNFDAELEKFPGKKAFINENIERLRVNIKAFVHDMAHMSKEHDAGDIDIRIPEEKFEGGYRVMAKGVNDMVFGHIAVKKKAMACLAEFAAGNFDAPLEKFPGKKVFINDNIELLRRNSKALVADANVLSKAAVEGKLATRADASKHQGDFRKIVQGVNETLDAVIGPLNVSADYVDKISKGNIPAKITDTYNGDFNTIKNNLNQCIDAVNNMVADAGLLAKAAVEGKLATRADASKHQGDYRKIVQGVNETLDAVIGPLNVSADYVDKISKGNIPERITDTYNGDFNTIKNNLNKCIDAVNRMAGDATMLAKAAVEGKLATRADATKHEGDFRKIVQGVNETLDAVIGPLNVSADYVDKISRGNIPPRITDSYNGDFNTIKNNLNRCVDAVNSLVADTETLVRASIEGKLSTRADASKHEGDYRRIVDGVNKTLDAVIAPVMEAAGALETLARYDLRARVTGDYQGDHARIKDALNGTAKALQDALSQVADAVEQVSEASQQIAGSSQAVSQGASEQASSLEETSSSLEEMAGMTKQNADNTIQARSLAQTTKEAAEKGGTAMVRMTDAMEKIRAASQGTADIIKDINEIAFQTNLLALNAAVEAARAGDAGRGFAVVAEEVRNLALRSKEAAKKTEDLIKVAVGHAENGRIITNEVAGSLTEIVTAAAKVNDIVSEIAVASQEQSRGIEQVNTAVAEMDKVVQTAASNAEESSSAAEELASQSEELSSLVQRFELDRDNRTAARRHAPAAKEPAAPRRAGMHPATIPPPRRGAVIVNRAKRPNGANGTTHKPSAEDLIPLEKDPEFQDF
jgi:methyl-accepting chemotaxis protein